jgi:ubiquinone biosynthesis accessory factor UbiJ
MLHTLNSLLAPAVMGRLTLVINHVLGSESAATSRLMAHSGRTVELLATAWPPLLPPPPLLAFRVTPAGLLEWCGPERGGAADLAVRVDTSNPALLFSRALSGELPPVEIDGDAALAADVNWLMQNLRWDVEADLERVFGPLVAPQLHRLGSALAGAMKVAMQTAMQTAGNLGGRLRPRA